MNESAAEAAKVYLKRHLFPPQKNWPKYYFEERSYSQWAAKEIIERIVSSEKDPYEIIRSFINEMDNLSGVKEGTRSEFIFATARDTAKTILLYLSKKEGSYGNI